MHVIVNERLYLQLVSTAQDMLTPVRSAPSTACLKRVICRFVGGGGQRAGTHIFIISFK